VVWQDDLLLSNLTVEENIYFAARLKTPEDISDAKVSKIVEETMDELGLLRVRHSLVGSPLASVRGISGGERKRVSVAVELVARPSLLFLDEPTSGLDATTALSLISTLKDLASLGYSIAVVIHQPRTTIYNQFDHLLLLSRGRVIFDGAPCQARTYLEACPTVTDLPPETGIADWIMDIITEDEGRSEGGCLAQNWATYSVSAATRDDGNGNNKLPVFERRYSSLQELESVPKFHTSFWTQLKLLTFRTLKQQRGERLTATALILQLSYLFFTALFWWRMPDTTGWIFERNSLLFFIIIAQANGVVISAVTVFQREREYNEESLCIV
jgi:ABC-type multidrug transport system ATPase subunit